MDNEATVGNQWVAPSNPFYAKNVPVPKRDVARAKALLKEAGVPNPSFTLSRRRRRTRSASRWSCRRWCATPAST